MELAETLCPPLAVVLDAGEQSMPVALSFLEPSTFVVRGAGHVTYEEIQTLLADVLEHPRLCCGVRVLVDGRLVRGAPSTEELRTIARHLKPLLDRGLGPIAIVATSPFIYGVARMFSVFAEAMRATVAPFRGLDEANAWLKSYDRQAAAS
jgi:hypothetical protein